MNLSETDLVTFSSCRSAKGGLSKTRDVAGIRFALMFAGAKHALLTHFPVSNQTSTSFMKAFYGHLLETGPNKMQSYPKFLRSTKLAFIKEGIPSFVWAPYAIYRLN